MTFEDNFQIYILLKHDPTKIHTKHYVTKIPSHHNVNGQIILSTFQDLCFLPAMHLSTKAHWQSFKFQTTHFVCKIFSYIDASIFASTRFFSTFKEDSLVRSRKIKFISSNFTRELRKNIYMCTAKTSVDIPRHH